MPISLYNVLVMLMQFKIMESKKVYLIPILSNCLSLTV